MANIYELTGAFNTLWNLMEEGSIDDETLQEVFENTEEELSAKLEGYCKFIKNLESDIAGLKAEEKRLAEKRRVMENTIERAKFAMQMAMNASGNKKMPCGSFTVSLQKNPESVVMDEQYIENIPEEYLKYKDPEIDRAKIKEHLKAGVNLEGIAHLEQSEGLRIR